MNKTNFETVVVNERTVSLGRRGVERWWRVIRMDGMYVRAREEGG